ncbi:hypothetical protein D9611_007874 [Ephemerocybe angulata]|uniref:Uncharacterized protein n=1 Tax=Ephemerocybe angulata TaxID=980116 RepID=A0A8H5CG78_9AGAR|nr:hypothetical protein D9611_007874 [Tulosesus angulatus]
MRKRKRTGLDYGPWYRDGPSMFSQASNFVIHDLDAYNAGGDITVNHVHYHYHQSQDVTIRPFLAGVVTGVGLF